MMGSSYFINKDISVLRDYFGYSGTVIEDDTGTYMYFTNRENYMYMKKDNVVTYKESKSSKIIDLVFLELSDGCLVYPRTEHYTLSYETGKKQRITGHYNDNSDILSRYNNFTSVCNRSNCYPVGYNNTMFNKSSPGDYYYLYEETRKPYDYPWIGDPSVVPYISASIHKCYVYEITVYNTSKITSDRVLAYHYNERTSNYSDESYTAITETQAKNIYNQYLKMGYINDLKTTGIEVLVQVVNGKVEKIVDTDKFFSKSNK